jgi:AcrR family transcriptional regulator
MTRTERRRATTRGKLVAAARQVFAAKGFYAATISDITEAADVGFGTFYLHFPGKEAIFAAVVEEGFDQLRSDIEAELAGAGDFEERQRKAMRAYVRFAYHNRDLFRTMFDAGAISLELLQRIQQPFEERIAAALQLGVSLGLLRPVNPELLAPLITAALRRAGLWYRDHDAPAPDQLADELSDFVLLGLRARL